MFFGQSTLISSIPQAHYTYLIPPKTKQTHLMEIYNPISNWLIQNQEGPTSNSMINFLIQPINKRYHKLKNLFLSQEIITITSV